MVVALEARIYWREVPHAFGLHLTCALAAFDHDSLAWRHISPEQQPAIHKVFVLERGHERIGTPFAGYRQQAILTAEDRDYECSTD